MTRSRMGFFFSVFLLGVLAWWRSPSPESENTFPREFRPPSRSVSELLALSLPLPRPSAPPDAEEAVCRSQWREIAEINVAAYRLKTFDDPGLVRLDKVEDLLVAIERVQTAHPCGAKGNDALRAKSAAMLKWCRLSRQLGPAKATEIGDEPDMPRIFQAGLTRSSPMDKCLANFEMLRQDTAELSTRGLPLSEITDLSVLANKFFSRGRQDPSDLAGLVAITDRMLELEPGNAYAMDVAAQVAYARWRKDGVEVPRLETLEAGTKDGGEALRLKLQYQLERGNLEAVQELAERVAVVDKDSNLALFYLAQVAFGRGDVATTNRYLAEIGKGFFADYKAQAYIAQKRIQTEDLALTSEVPLFAHPGITLTTAFMFPDGTTDSAQRGLTVGGSTGFNLTRDEFYEVVVDRYRNYWEETPGLHPR